MTMTSHSLRVPHASSLYISGQWVRPRTPDTFTVLNCATEDVVARVALATEADVSTAVQAAREAFDRGPWPRMTPAQRAVYLAKIAERLEAMNDEFARGWSIESGILFKIARPRVGLFLSGSFRSYTAMASTYPFVRPVRSV